MSGTWARGQRRRVGDRLDSSEACCSCANSPENYIFQIFSVCLFSFSPTLEKRMRCHTWNSRALCGFPPGEFSALWAEEIWFHRHCTQTLSEVFLWFHFPAWCCCCPFPVLLPSLAGVQAWLPIVWYTQGKHVCWNCWSQINDTHLCTSVRVCACVAICASWTIVSCVW